MSLECVGPSYGCLAQRCPWMSQDSWLMRRGQNGARHMKSSGPSRDCASSCSSAFCTMGQVCTSVARAKRKQMRRETINMSLKCIEAASCCVRVICFDKWLERKSRSQTARFWHHKAWWLGHGGQGQAFKPSNTPLQDFKTVLASIPYLPSCSSFHCPLCCAIASGHGDYKICLRTAWFAWLWELKLRIFGSHGSTWLKWKCKVIGVIWGYISWVEEMWKHTHCILLQYAAAAIHTFFSGLALDLRHLAGYLAQAAVRRGAQPVDAPQCQTPSQALRRHSCRWMDKVQACAS